MKTYTVEDLDAVRPVDPDRIAALAAQMRQEVRAARLRELREAQGLRQVDVAAELDVSQHRVSQIENGDTASARVETLRRYVEALGGTLRVEATFGDTTLTVA